MVINGVNLPDIDVADALAMERYEHAHDNVANTTLFSITQTYMNTSTERY